MRPHSTAGRTSHVVQVKRVSGAVVPPQPMQKPSRRVFSGSSRAIWCSMDHCITRMAGRSLVHGCSIGATAPAALSCWIPAGPVVSSATHTKKNAMLPAVRRSTGITSNQIASVALKASVGSAMNRLGLTSSHRSTWRSSARTNCATSPTTSVAQSSPPITARWLAHFASRYAPRRIEVVPSSCQTRVSKSRCTVPRTR